MVLLDKPQPSRKQQLLKRITLRPEAERRKQFRIGRLLEDQDKHQSQPFLQTPLGKLPLELRVMIYENLVVMQQYQKDTGVKSTLPTSKQSFLGQSFSAPTQRFIHLKRSSLSILRTCRQVRTEAQATVYSGAIPFLANPWELFRFLTGIGPSGRLQLQALRIGQLVIQDLFREPECSDCVRYRQNERYNLCHCREKGPETKRAFGLLVECKNLRMIYTALDHSKIGRQFPNFKTYVNRAYAQLCPPGIHHCFAQRSGDLLFHTNYQEFPHRMELYRPLVSPIQRFVEVKLDKIHHCSLIGLVMNPPFGPQPFLETYFGKLPIKIRTQIYRELVAIPQIYAGQRPITQHVHAKNGGFQGPLQASTTFIHLQASCLAILRVCVQIYAESHPVFYSHNSLHTDNKREFDQLARLSVRLLPPSPIRCETIRSLYLKDIVSWSDEKGCYLDHMTLVSISQLTQWKGLQTICFCMHVGEELGYLEFLFLLSGMGQGAVEFLDESHWVLHQQSTEDVWQIQYACFENNWMFYRKGKDNMELSDDVVELQRQQMRTDSRAVGLNDGDERFVEVSIGMTSDQCSRWDVGDLTTRLENLSLDH